MNGTIVKLKMALCSVILLFASFGVLHSQSFTITRTSSSVLYIDTTLSPRLTCMYAAYEITNTSGINYSDIWIKAGNFSGSNITLAANEDGEFRLGKLDNGQTKIAYFYLKATGVTGSQSHKIKVFSGPPSLTALDSASFSMTADQRSQSTSNVITSAVLNTTSPIIGGTFTMTVSGNSGTIQALQSMFFTPAAYAAWPADKLELVSTQITTDSDGRVYTDSLVIPGPLVSLSTNYSVVYTFRVNGITSATAALSPCSFVNNNVLFGIQHTNSAIYGSLTPVNTTTNTTTLRMSATPTQLDTGGNVNFTVTLTNTGTNSVTIEDIFHTLAFTPGTVTYVAGSSTYNSVLINDPAQTDSTIKWYGTFNIPAGQSRELKFQLLLPSVSGSYANSARAHVATVQIDTTLDITDNKPAVQIVSIDFVPTVVSAIPDTTVYEDSPALNSYRDLNKVFTDVESGSALTFSITGNTNTSLLTPSIDNTDSTLDIAFLSNASGVATITIRAADNLGYYVEDSFIIAVAAVNDTPTVISAIPNLTDGEDPGSRLNYVDLNNVFNDIENGRNLTFTVAGNSNSSLVTAVVDPADSTLDLTFGSNANGTASIIIRAQDAQSAAVQDTFLVTIFAINDLPYVVSSIPDLNVSENSIPIDHIDLNAVFNDVEDGSHLNFSIANNSNPSLVTPTIVAADSILRLTFSASVSGVSTIIVKATDGNSSFVQDTFVVTVFPGINETPIVIAPIPDLNVFEDNGAVNHVDLNNVFDDTENGHNLAFSIVQNSNSGLVTPSIGSGDSVLSLTFIENANGVSSLIIRAKDALNSFVQDTFIVTVTAVNDTPIVILAIPDLKVEEGQAPIFNYADLNETFSDVEDEQLSFTIQENSNPGLVTVVIDPVDSTIDFTDFNGTGRSTIVIRASDAQSAFKDLTFIVSVTDTIAPDPPTQLHGVAGNESIALAWMPSSGSDFLKYYVYGDTVTNSQQKLDSTSAFNINDTTIVISGLIAGKTYFFHVTASDTFGNESDPSNEIQFLALDLQDPSIGDVIVTPNPVNFNNPVTVTFCVEDNQSIDSLIFEYKNGGDCDFTQIPVTGTQCPYSVVINSNIISIQGGIFRITAIDQSHNETSVMGSVSVRLSQNALRSSSVAGNPYESGFPEDTWRLISIPLILDNPNVKNVLSNFGTGGTKTWRLFDGAVEGTDTLTFALGRAYWLKHKLNDSNIPITPGAGSTADLASTQVALNPGWNRIGNPFIFPVALPQDADIVGPLRWDGVKYISEGQTGADLIGLENLQPFEGYFVWNATDSIKMLSFSSECIAKKLSKRNHPKTNTKWAMNISVKAGVYEDNYNFAGIVDGSFSKKVNLTELPVMGDYVSAYFIEKNIHGNDTKLTTSYKSLQKDGHVWEMEVKTNVSNKENILSWNAEQFSDEKTWVIIDVSHNHVIDLNQNSYSFVNDDEEHPVRFKIIMGTPLFIQNELERIESELPKKYSLRQNYPNPFNPVTTIRYEIPIRSQVSLKIYNVLGQEINTVVKNTLLDPGQYSIQWDGRNNKGDVVSSGIYIYRLQANQFVQSKKMILIK
ncbi:T9SS type A sorting domain-containing protein [bacterium]|nr:T9SS type A sorting domain-containing protein [bacterium]